MKKLLVFALLLGTFSMLQAQIVPVPETQLSLVTKRTATWCSNCGLAAWDIMEYFFDNLEDKAVIISAHYSASSDLHSSTAVDLVDNFASSFGQPTFFFNEDNLGGGVSNTQTNMEEMVNEAYASSPTAQVGLEVFYNEATNEITVNTTTEFFQAGSGEYSVAIYILEDVVNFQSNQGASALHKNVIRQSLTLSSFGQPLVAGMVQAGTKLQYSLSQAFSTSYDLDETKIAAIVWKKTGEDYEFVNANITDDIMPEITSSTNAASKLLSGLKLSPNATANETILTFDLTEDQVVSQINITNAQGQIVRDLGAKNLAAGTHRFDIQRGTLSAGMYRVNVNLNGQIFSEALIIQ